MLFGLMLAKETQKTSISKSIALGEAGLHLCSKDKLAHWPQFLVQVEF